MNVIETLLDLQAVDADIRDLEKQEKDIPRLKAKENARLAGVNAALEIAKSQLEAMQKRIADEKAEEADALERANQLKNAQTATSTKKELEQSYFQVEALEHQASAARNRVEALERDDLPKLERGVAEAEAKVLEEKGGVSGEVDDLDARLAEVKSALDAKRADRVLKANAVKVLDPGFLLYYERLSTKRWPVVVPITEDGVCDGCHMKQPPYVSQMVQHNTAHAQTGSGKIERAVCTMCGRLLYGV